VNWTDEAEQILGALLQMVPETLRPLAGDAARGEAEALCAERGAHAVAVEDVVRGWIATTPADQRDSLVPILDQLGLEPEDYADELTRVAEDETES
jgi:hypothetical protein